MGGTLFRAREEEFNTVFHKGGISPEWGLKYADFEPYYTQAEELYNVHGKRGLDPTEPWTNSEYSFPAISHEPCIQEVHDDLQAQGFHPFYLPMAIKLNEAQKFLSECIRCETCVGRNFMKHNCGVVVGLMAKENPTVFQKTLGINDFYWGEPDFPYPMGQVQLSGKVNKDMLMDNVPVAIGDEISPKDAALHSVDWWLMGEDLPDRDNRVHIKGDKIHVDYTENNAESFNRLVDRWIEVLKSISVDRGWLMESRYYQSNFPLRWVAHQCGTCRFGVDPETSVLDLNCRAHDVDNLYVVDGSFFPSNIGLNPTLTIIANALRVGDHLSDRLK